MGALSLAATESEQIELAAVQGRHSLYNDLLQVPEPASRRHELVFEQKNRLLGRHRRIVLFNGRYLEWTEQRGRRELVRIINLAFLAGSPRSYREIAWRSLSVALLALIVAGLLLAVGQAVAAMAALGVSLVGLGICLRGSSRRLLFYSRNGQVVMFDLFDQRGDRKRFAKVVGALQLRGERAWALLPDRKERLAAEVAEHRRLMREGVISQARYEHAKQRIFRRYSE